jgi:prepilin-type N-terminal cleavage/methylation domain-containing protein
MTFFSGGRGSARVSVGAMSQREARAAMVAVPRNCPINHQITKSPDHQIQRQRGFTLIELLVVLTMIVVLASMGLAQYRTSVIHSREAVLKEDLFRMREAIDQYYADKGQYPSTLDALVSDGYLR